MMTAPREGDAVYRRVWARAYTRAMDGLGGQRRELDAAVRIATAAATSDLQLRLLQTPTERKAVGAHGGYTFYGDSE